MPATFLHRNSTALSRNLQQMIQLMLLTRLLRITDGEKKPRRLTGDDAQVHESCGRIFSLGSDREFPAAWWRNANGSD